MYLPLQLFQRGISDKKILFKKEIKFANTKNVFTFAAAFRGEQRKRFYLKKN